MKLFLTSSPSTGWGGPLTPANGFTDRLRSALPGKINGLFIASAPSDHAQTDGFGTGMKSDLEAIGICFADFHTLDDRNAADTFSLVRNADLIILAGGHVPTQNAFFQRIRLRESLRNFDGVVMGISAGTMNSAELVYAQPELEGESIDPDYRRFLPGLGLTERMILPHYNQVKDDMLDGKRLFEDITFADSLGHTFYVFYDGTYLLSENGKEAICGASLQIRDGIMTELSADGEILVLCD